VNAREEIAYHLWMSVPSADNDEAKARAEVLAAAGVKYDTCSVCGAAFSLGKFCGTCDFRARMAAEVPEKASVPAPTATPNFFEPGRTYAVNDGVDRVPTLDWIFTVEAVGREPGEHGRRVAFGYLSNRAGRQPLAHIESAESWTNGWTDITNTTGDNT
jgi:hypothetical protein